MVDPDDDDVDDADVDGGCGVDELDVVERPDDDVVLFD